LFCTQCGQDYQITEGVPHLLPSEQLQIKGEDMTRLQHQTVERFGFEWRYFQDWGWLPDYPDVPEAELKFRGGLVKHTESAFWSKSLFSRDDLQAGNLVLDAGCGNGRFTNQTAQTGAEVIGIDLGWGVFSAFEHTRSLPNAHIVRGDLFRLPFTGKTFDRVFCIGVLQHTGSAGAAFDSLVRVLQDGGLIVAHVYGRGLWTYELLDKTLRSVTIRLPISAQLAFSRWMAALARWLRRSNEKLYWKIYRHINLLPTTHHMYDWWSAPIATHYAREEVLSWFERNGLEVLRANPPNDQKAELSRKRGHAAITILGRCPQQESGQNCES
jgi:SAM-dependent methyltransferase